MPVTAAREYIGVGAFGSVDLGTDVTRLHCPAVPSKAYLRNAGGPAEGLVLYRRANRQYVAMSRKEIWQFLTSQRRVYLGFTMANGYPHVTPIWFVVKGEKIYMRAQDYKVKVDLAETGKACVVIDDGDLYRELRGTVMWGRSRILHEKGLIAKITEEFEKKYSRRQWKADEMPKDWVSERNKERRAFIEFVPEKVDSWDNRKVADRA